MKDLERDYSARHRRRSTTESGHKIEISCANAVNRKDKSRNKFFESARESLSKCAPTTDTATNTFEDEFSQCAAWFMQMAERPSAFLCFFNQTTCMTAYAALQIQCFFYTGACFNFEQTAKVWRLHFLHRHFESPHQLFWRLSKQGSLRMEIQQLKGFHAVARYGNFTVAAEKTFRTQPTISLQIKSLEDELGVQLFERVGSKRILLTEEGKIFLELTSQLIDDLDSLHQRFHEMRGIYAASSLTVATHQAVMMYCLPDVIKALRVLFPQTQLSFLHRSRDEIIHAVENGEVDLGITSSTDLPHSLDYHVFSRFNRILITCANHPLSQKSEITLDDLAEYPLILPNRQSHSRRAIDSAFQQQGLEYSVVMEIAGRSVIKTYVGMDLGISIMNEYFVSPEDREKLFVHDISHLFGQTETGIVTRKNRVLSRIAREFIRLLLQLRSNIPEATQHITDPKENENNSKSECLSDYYPCDADSISTLP